MPPFDNDDYPLEEGKQEDAVIAIIGAQGSGKSSFVKALARYPRIVDCRHEAGLRFQIAIGYETRHISLSPPSAGFAPRKDAETRRIELLDTPWFTTGSSDEHEHVVKGVWRWLARDVPGAGAGGGGNGEGGGYRKVTHVIYLHPHPLASLPSSSDPSQPHHHHHLHSHSPQQPAKAKHSIKLITELLGTEDWRRVMLVTTFSDLVAGREDEARDAESALWSDMERFGELVRRGARVGRCGFRLEEEEGGEEEGPEGVVRALLSGASDGGDDEVGDGVGVGGGGGKMEENEKGKVSMKERLKRVFG